MKRSFSRWPAKTSARDAFYRDLRQDLAGRFKEFDALSAEVCFNMAQAFTHAEGLMSERAYPTGLTLPGLNVLIILQKHGEGGCPLHGLSDLLVVSRANITGLVDSLVRKGLVARSEHATDRRIVLAQITPKGSKLLKTYLPTHYSTMRELAEPLTRTEKETLIRLLSKVRHVFQKSARLAIGLVCLSVLAPAVRADMPLTLSDAIRLAIQNNLTYKLAKATTEEARGRAIQSAAGLLPKLTASLYQARFFKTNLAAQGFTGLQLPGFNPLIGPYDSFDARLQLTQSILDLSEIWRAKAGRSGEKIATLQEGLAREQVAAAAALAYLESHRANRDVTAAQADLKLAESLLKLARDQHSAGVSTGVDVARAETARAQEDLRLIRAQLAVSQADLRLKRVVGLPLDEKLVLPDIPREAESDLPVIDQLLTSAQQDRFELRISQEGLVLSQNQLKSAKAQHLPSLVALADYGYSGSVPNGSARTGSIGGRLNLPILTGGNVHGQVVEAEAQQREAEDRQKDVTIQVEEDVRLALQSLTSEIQETHTADLAVSLAQKELKMAQDRFAAGAGDNIQVLNAQTALARALDDQIDAFARYDSSRVNLATAVGRVQQFK